MSFSGKTHCAVIVFSSLLTLVAPLFGCSSSLPNVASVSNTVSVNDELGNQSISLAPLSDDLSDDLNEEQGFQIQDSGVDLAPLDEFLQGVVDNGTLQDGLAFLLLVDGEVVYRKSFGGFDPDQVTQVASTSKWISGAVIMSLIDDGVISLDDQIQDHLDGFNWPKSTITIRQLFSHTHGWPNDPRPNRKASLTMEEAVNRISFIQLVAMPGEALYYSGLGMQVAGYIGTIRTGRNWNQLFEERIGRPLGMDSTNYYGFEDKYWPFNWSANPNVAGSVQTTLNDLGRFVRMIYNRGVYRDQQILSPQAIDTMISNQSGDLTILSHPWERYVDIAPNLASAPSGIGVWLEDIDPNTGLALSVSATGGYGTTPFIDWSRDLAGVLLTYDRDYAEDEEFGISYKESNVVYIELRQLLSELFPAE